MNDYLDDFMMHCPYEGLTFDDVSLITQYADFLPETSDIGSQLTRNIRLNIPFVSAAMDTVTDAPMATAMALLGGIGIIHKNLTPSQQARAVNHVKHHLHGLIRKPVTFRDTDKLSHILGIKDEQGYTFSGFPILNADNALVGVLTSADLKFAQDSDLTVADIMTKDLITAPQDTTLQDAYKIMQTHKIGKLPLVNGDKLTGLYSFTDVSNVVEETVPWVNRDSKYRLRAGAAVGPKDEERIEHLVNEDIDVLVVDTAHGHTKGVIDITKWIKKTYPDVDVIAGNIATGQAALALRDAGADAVKVGIGPGSICTTRVIAGVGVPQITAIYEVAKALAGSIPVIADGGVRHSGDIPKAIAAGANTVMMGSILAGTEESPGEKIIHQGRQYVVYRGMGSLAAMKEGQGSKDRYSQSRHTDDELVPEGIEGIVPFAGSVRKVMTQFCGGLRASMGYSGCPTIEELQQRGRFVRVSLAGLAEAHPHDVKIMKEAPNYRS